MRRVQSVSRLLFKPPRDRQGNALGTNCEPMVQRAKTPTVTIGDAALGKATGDIKKSGAWRYPGGVIQRYPTVEINGRRYTDDKDPDMARRKHESNFFITLNTNQCLRHATPEEANAAKQAVAKTLKELAGDKYLCSYLKFGPKSSHYKDDRYEDVVQSAEWNSSVETGATYDRLHCHIWLTLHHYSQIQVSMPLMQRAFKERYNHYVKGTAAAKYAQKKQPYIQVKLLPSSDWADVIKQYIHKAMASSDE